MKFPVAPKAEWVQADFNGLFSEFVCLSHGGACKLRAGGELELQAGMVVAAFDEDADEHGNRDDLFATGTVEQSPEWLQCRGSRWVLRIDDNRVRSESDIPDL